MLIPGLKRCRLVKIKFFMISMILFSTYLFVSYALLQKLTSGSQKIKVFNTPVNLPNVVLHLDLKGSPPKISYMEELLPKLKELGVTSFLIEYEDMFPYEGRLVNLSAKYAYRKSELQNFLKMLVSLDFDVIPLVQTFGHMEHVLKLKEFGHLRELPNHVDVICPSKHESLMLIRDMVKQVIKFHRDIFPLNYFHIGSDEVYHINKCKQCLQRKQTKTNIYLNHVRAITHFVREINPKTTVLMWEDMLRYIPMKEWDNVGSLKVEPVYWEYMPRLKVSHVALKKYHKTFDNIWIASAFKGADGSTATLPNLRNRFLNNLSWMKLVQTYKFGGETDTFNFRGIILTGWSRYSHTSPNCELLPVSIPSLFLNLLLIKKFKSGNNWIESDDVSDFFNKNINDDLTELLHCKVPINIDHFDIEFCSFDGSDLYKTIDQCDVEIAYISRNVDDIVENETFYNYATKPVDNHIINKYINDLLLLEDRMINVLSRYYDKYFVAEYVNYKLKPLKKRLMKLFKNERDINLKFQVL